MSNDDYNMRTVIEAQVKLAVIRWYSLMAAAGAVAVVSLLWFAAWESSSTPVPERRDCIKYATPSLDQRGTPILELKETN